MLIDIKSTFGEELSLASAAVIGDAIDTGAVYGLGAGANRLPILHVVIHTANTSAGTIELCTSSNGTTAGDTLVKIPVGAATPAETVVYSGPIPQIPEGSGRYLVLKTSAMTAGKCNAYLLANSPYHHIYPKA